MNMQTLLDGIDHVDHYVDNSLFLRDENNNKVAVIEETDMRHAPLVDHLNDCWHKRYMPLGGSYRFERVSINVSMNAIMRYVHYALVADFWWDRNERRGRYYADKAFKSFDMVPEKMREVAVNIADQTHQRAIKAGSTWRNYPIDNLPIE